MFFLLSLNPWFSFFYKARVGFRLLSLSCLFTLGLVEIVVRLTDPIGISYYEELRREAALLVSDKDLYKRYRQGLKETLHGVDIKINELGFRDRSGVAKPPGQFRILFLGDSVTFGTGVKADDTFVRRIEALAAPYVNHNISTINTGVSSYNTQMQWSVVNKFGDYFQPDLVILLYVTNDIEMTPSKPYDSFRELSISGKSPPEVLEWILARSWGYRLVYHLFVRHDGGAHGAIEPDAPGLRVSKDSVIEISQYFKEKNVPFVVFFFRYRENEFNNHLIQELQSVARRAGLLIKDTLPWYSTITDFAPITNSRVDAHPNADGHAILAEGMTQFLVRQGLLRPAGSF